MGDDLERLRDDRYLNTMPRLVIWLNKPLSRYYRDDEYLEGLNDINMIIGINIHLFIIESPGYIPSLRRINDNSRGIRSRN